MNIRLIFTIFLGLSGLLQASEFELLTLDQVGMIEAAAQWHDSILQTSLYPKRLWVVPTVAAVWTVGSVYSAYKTLIGDDLLSDQGLARLSLETFMACVGYVVTRTTAGHVKIMSRCKKLLRKKYTAEQIEEFRASSYGVKASPEFIQFLRSECVKNEETKKLK